MHWDKDNATREIVAGKTQKLWKDPVDILMFSPDILAGQKRQDRDTYIHVTVSASLLSLFIMTSNISPFFSPQISSNSPTSFKVYTSPSISSPKSCTHRFSTTS